MHEVLVNRLGGLSLPRKIVVRLTDRPDMTLDVYRGRKTTIQSTTKKQVNDSLKSHHIFSRRQIQIQFMHDCFVVESLTCAHARSALPVRKVPTLATLSIAEPAAAHSTLKVTNA